MFYKYSSLGKVLSCELIPIQNGAAIEADLLQLDLIVADIKATTVASADSMLDHLRPKLESLLPRFQSFDRLQSLLGRIRGFFRIPDKFQQALNLVKALDLKVEDLEYFNSKSDIIRGRLQGSGESFNETIFIDFSLAMNLFHELGAASNSLQSVLQALADFGQAQVCLFTFMPCSLYWALSEVQQDESFITVVANHMEDIQTAWKTGSQGREAELQTTITNVLNSGR